MTDILNLVMLVSAAIGSLALGVLSAYGVLQVAFAMMRSQRKTAAKVKARAEVARIS